MGCIPEMMTIPNKWSHKCTSIFTQTLNHIKCNRQIRYLWLPFSWKQFFPTTLHSTQDQGHWLYKTRPGYLLAQTSQELTANIQWQNNCCQLFFFNVDTMSIVYGNSVTCLLQILFLLCLALKNLSVLIFMKYSVSSC